MRNKIDSNAPPRTRGTPYGFARGTPVVANRQPLARGRPLTKLRDGPEICRINKMHNWDWNAPPIRGTTSVFLCENLSLSAVKRIHRKESKAGAMHFKESECYHVPPGGNIRGKPFVLHDTESLTGGRTKTKMPENGIVENLFRYNINLMVLRMGEICPITTQKNGSDETI